LTLLLYYLCLLPTALHLISLFPIFTKLSVDRTPLLPPTFHLFRRLHSIDIDSFLADLQCSRLITNPPKSLGSLLIAYNYTLSSLLDKHAPVITKITRFSSRKSKSNPWFTSSLLLAFKSTVRHAENIRKRTHSGLGHVSVCVYLVRIYANIISRFH